MIDFASKLGTMKKSYMSQVVRKNTVAGYLHSLANGAVVRRPRTLLLDEALYSQLAEMCEKTNAANRKSNNENRLKPPAERDTPKKMIKPCDIIDDLLRKLFEGKPDESKRQRD